MASPAARDCGPLGRQQSEEATSGLREDARCSLVEGEAAEAWSYQSGVEMRCELHNWSGRGPCVARPVLWHQPRRGAALREHPDHDATVRIRIGIRRGPGEERMVVYHINKFLPQREESLLHFTVA